MTTKAIAIAATKAVPPMPKPLVTVRMTGLAMMSPTAVASAVGKPTMPELDGVGPAVSTPEVDEVAPSPITLELMLLVSLGSRYGVRQRGLPHAASRARDAGR